MVKSEFDLWVVAIRLCSKAGADSYNAAEQLDKILGIDLFKDWLKNHTKDDFKFRLGTSYEVVNSLNGPHAQTILKAAAAKRGIPLDKIQVSDLPRFRGL